MIASAVEQMTSRKLLAAWGPSFDTTMDPDAFNDAAAAKFRKPSYYEATMIIFISRKYLSRVKITQALSHNCSSLSTTRLASLSTKSPPLRNNRRKSVEDIIVSRLFAA